MPDFSQRSPAIEIMDDLSCSGPVVDRTLVELESINKWLGGNRITLDGLKKLLNAYNASTDSLTIADLGCGGGDMLQLMAKKLRQKKQKVVFTGIDANPSIVTYAQTHSKSYPEIQFKTMNIFSEEFRKERYDMVFATLFFHHFSQEELISTFTALKKIAKCGVVVNDLHRHWFAYYAIKFLTGIFSKSSMVKNDAPLSVHRGFKRQEWIEILKASGIASYSLHWKWAYRWQLIIYNAG